MSLYIELNCKNIIFTLVTLQNHTTRKQNIKKQKSDTHKVIINLTKKTKS